MTSTKEMELLEHHKYKGIIGLHQSREEEVKPNFKAPEDKLGKGEFFPKLGHKKA